MVLKADFESIHSHIDGNIPALVDLCHRLPWWSASVRSSPPHRQTKAGVSLEGNEGQ